MPAFTTVSPFDPRRLRALTQALEREAVSDAAALLSSGAAWRDPDAGPRYQRYLQAAVRLPGYELELALAAEPLRFSQDAATFLVGLEPEHRLRILVQASLTAEPLGLAGHEWLVATARGTSAGEALGLALGGLERGDREVAPAQVAEAAAALARVEPAGLPPVLTDTVQRLEALCRDAVRPGSAFRVVCN